MKTHFEVKMKSNSGSVQWFQSSYHEIEKSALDHRNLLRTKYPQKEFEAFRIETTETLIKEGK